MRPIKLTVLLLTMGLVLVLASACAASTPAPTATSVPPTPTVVPPPATLAPTQTTAPAVAATATSAPAATATSAAAGPTATAAPAASGEVTGDSLFLLSCAACHGQDRGGNKFTMDNQSISVPALAWADLNKTYQTQPSRGTVAQQLALTITKGLDETGGDLNAMMPRWSSLSSAQVDSLVQYLQNPPASSGGTPTLTGAAANLQGEALYQAACAACHGQDRAGQKFTMDNQSISVPGLAWADLTKTFQTQPSRGTVEQQLGLAITKGLDETGGDLNAMMPHWSFLSQAQVDSLVQYLKTAGQ